MKYSYITLLLTLLEQIYVMQMNTYLNLLQNSLQIKLLFLIQLNMYKFKVMEAGKTILEIMEKYTV